MTSKKSAEPRADAELREKRKRHLMNSMVGAPHKCGSWIFWEYRRKSDQQFVWYCYRCYPPKRLVNILAISDHGTRLKAKAAKDYHRKRHSQRKRTVET